MNDTKHTPGPWRVVATGRKKDSLDIRAESGAWVANRIVGGGTCDDGAANAALIARAPTLLAELTTARAENASLRESLAKEPPCDVHFGARRACGQCHDSNVQHLKNSRADAEKWKADAERLAAELRAMILERGCAGCLIEETGKPPYVRGKNCRIAADEHAPECATTPALAALKAHEATTEER